jgi:thiosulfate/3-mercaptopyruvate sulfurtransferase
MDRVGADGQILESATLHIRLVDLGIIDKTQVVSYCTAGIRSGFGTAVLKAAGVNTCNYASSMWEWSAEDAAAYPLVTE